MKVIFIFLCMLVACSKEDTPNVQLPKCESVTNLIDRYTTAWKYIRTDTAIHWCSLCNDDEYRLLDRYRSMVGRKELLCPGMYDSIYWVVGVDRCQIN